MSSISEDEQTQLDRLAEEYATRKRAGEQPDIEWYAREYPNLATDIRELFPVLGLLDSAKQKTDSVAANDAEIGTGTMLGDYQLLRPLGRGGMGVVYQAEHLTLGSIVAIKILPPALDRPKLRERFQREASAAARMQHPNIVQVFDFGRYGPSLYFVMQLVNGWGLDRVISGSEKPSVNRSFTTGEDVTPTQTELVRSGSGGNDPSTIRPETNESAHGAELSRRSVDRKPASGSIGSSGASGAKLDSLWNWVANVGIQAADALSYAHSIGVIHRDIKPSNLMIDAENVLYVTDFGLAKVAGDSELTATGDLLGTLRYMPPEALSGKSDHRADIYGLGLTLYELLADGPALAEVERGKILAAISTGAIEPLRKRVAKVPRDLETIIQKSIELDPAVRYQSAAEMRDDLERFLAGETVLARRPTWLYRATRWMGRNLVVSTLAVGVILLLAAVATIALMNARRFEVLANQKAAEAIVAQKAEEDAKLARQTADAQTLVATTNLFAARLSEAAGFASSRRPGQRVEGMKALRSAIALSRDLNVFDQYRDRINSTAIILSTLHDLPREVQWKHQVAVDGYAPIAFNGDLSEYAHEDFQDRQPACKIYRVQDDKPVLIETIPLEGHFGEMALDMSDDGQILSSVMWGKRDEGVVLQPWVYNRRTGKTYFPEAKGNYWRFGESLRIRPGTHHVFILNRSNELVIFDADIGEAVSRFELPPADWSQISVSPDGRHVAVFVTQSNKLVLIDTESGGVRRLNFEGDEINELAWRPDNRQLAIAGDKISIWDLKNESVCVEFEHGESSATELQYSSDGRLLFVSGWKQFTQVFDALAGKRVLRCEHFLLDASSSGERMVFVASRDFEVRTVITSDTIWEYEFGGVTRAAQTGIDTKSSTLWLTPDFSIDTIDLVQHRVIAKRPTKHREASLTVDPLGREFVVSVDATIQQLPITPKDTIDANGETKQLIEIGPSELHYKPNIARDFRPYKLLLSNDGERLSIGGQSGDHSQVVSSRERNWLAISHTYSDRWAVQVVAHPRLPLVCTSTHHENEIEVRNTQTDKVVFRLPGKQRECRFSADGETLFTCAAGTMRSYRVGTWKLLAETHEDCAIAGQYMALSHDGAWIAVESLSPRGLLVLDTDRLEPVLRLPGDPSAPDSGIGSFDASGRLLACDRGIGVIGAWDLHKLRKHFESLELEWPLTGLGNPATLRDPSVDVTVNWELIDNGRSDAQHRHYYKNFAGKALLRKLGSKSKQ